MRTWIATALAALTIAAPARAAGLPATFGAPSESVAASADVATADLDGDGHPDFVVADGATVTALGKTYAAGGSPNALALGDLDHDGRPDIVAANGASLAVLRAQADGTFGAAATTAITGPEQALDVAIGQLAGDANPDAIVATGQPDVMVFPGDGAGGFGVPVFVPVQAATTRLALADVNGDARTDVAVATPLGVKLLFATPDGLVEQAPAYASAAAGLALADLNGDHHPDLITAGPDVVSVSMGRTGGVFDAPVDTDTDADAHDLAIADVSGDGAPDVLVTRTAGGLQLLAGSASGALGDAVSIDGRPTSAVAIADADGDGRPDLATAGEVLELRRNTTSRSTASAPATSDHRALTIAVATDGVAQPKVRLYVKPPGAAGFTRAAEQATTPFTYTATVDGAYAFYTTLVDADGNEEPAPAAPDATTTVTLTRAITAALAPFGRQLLGTASAPAEARLTNTGEATLSPHPQITGADFTLASDACTGTTLEPGDSCTIAVSFAPTAAGPRSARVSYDGGGFDLTGEGVAPPVIVSSPPPPKALPLPAIKLKVQGRLVATYKHGRLTRLVVRGVTRGATVKAKRGHTTFTKRHAFGTVSLAKLLKAKGRKVVVTITRAGMTSATQTLTIKKR
jgi:hypothetical protein